MDFHFCFQINIRISLPLPDILMLDEGGEKKKSAAAGSVVAITIFLALLA